MDDVCCRNRSLELERHNFLSSNVDLDQVLAVASMGAPSVRQSLTHMCLFKFWQDANAARRLPEQACCVAGLAFLHVVVSLQTL